ncbi:MAG: tripartite tricarboxylate transporter substrate binding protein [Enhydrobacter sp.]|nr:tripartite tricarboxylate transporter substrate binding protein [Enhydrobacter sp.]
MHISIVRRMVVALSLGLALATEAGAQDAWPTKPIRLIVPFAAGGPSDVVGRNVAAALAKDLGQQVIVDNKPGAGASLGVAIAARAPADGYTLLLGHSASISATAQMRKVSYDPRTDLVPIATFAANFTLLVARKDFPASNIAELKALALKAPDTVSCGTAGTGSGGHMACELLAELAGIKLLMVHYKGSSEAQVDLLGGRIDLGFDPSALPRVKEGALKVLATRSEGGKRFAGLPDIPSFAEQGLPDMTDELWFGLLAPAGTPPAIVQRVAAVAKSFVSAPDTAAKLMIYSLYPTYAGPDELKARMEKDWVFFGNLISRHNLRLD